jgi:hypothetical protein
MSLLALVLGAMESVVNGYPADNRMGRLFVLLISIRLSVSPSVDHRPLKA